MKIIIYTCIVVNIFCLIKNVIIGNWAGAAFTTFALGCCLFSVKTLKEEF